MRSRLERVALTTLGTARYLGESAALLRPEVVDAARVGASALRAHGSRPRWDAAEQRVLFFSPRYWSIHQAWEGTIAHALEQRGAATRFVACGGAMPLCDSHLLERMSRARITCADCVGRQAVYLGALGHRVETLASFLQEGALPDREIDALDTLEAIARFEHRGFPIGQFVRASLLRFFRAGELTGSEEEIGVGRAFLRGAAAVVLGGERLVERLRPTSVVVLNGKFYPERTMWAVAEARGVDVVTYERGFIEDTLLFARGKSATEYDISGELDEAFARGLTEEEDRALDEYLEARTRGARSIVQYWPDVEDRPEVVARALGLADDGTPITVAFPNILWDTAILDKDIHFESMFDWLDTTIRFFAAHPEQKLVIRCHPAEVRLPGQESLKQVASWIESTFPDLAPNITVVPPSSPLSSYVLGRAASRVLAYTSTVGLEMALAGKEVVVAGETHYANKGFTLEPESKAHYEGILARPAAPAPKDAILRARRYASLFFFRFMLPMHVVKEPVRARIALLYRDVAELGRGADATLDTICDGITSRRPFVLPQKP